MDENQGMMADYEFYVVAVGLTLCKSNFAKMLQSISESGFNLQYGIEMENYIGYLQIDCSHLDVTSTFSYFIKNLEDKILGKVAIGIADILRGEPSSKVVFCVDEFQFDFEITEYKRDREHNFQKVRSLTNVPVDEKVGRFVKLVITYVSKKIVVPKIAPVNLSGKTVLVVEDTDFWQSRMKKTLEKHGVDVLVADTIKKASIIFQSRKNDIHGIIMDACVSGCKMNTDKLVGDIIGAGYVGFIVAASGEPDHNEKLVAAGATHDGKNKDAALKLAVELLKE